MPHTYECPLRWADMDLLGHVNNVTYLDYVTEAREALLGGLPVGRAPVLRHQVAFVKPLVFRREPVLVDTWVTDIGDGEITFNHEVYDASSGAVTASERTVYLRATSVLAHRPTEEERVLLEQIGGLPWSGVR